MVRELAEFVPDHLREREDVQSLAAFGCPTRMRLLAPPFDNADHTKDFPHTASGRELTLFLPLPCSGQPRHLRCA